MQVLRGCLDILAALQEAGVVHNALDARAFLLSSPSVPVLVDAEIAAVPGLPPPASASMQHPRDLHAAGRPSDAGSLARSLHNMLRAPGAHLNPQPYPPNPKPSALTPKP